MGNLRGMLVILLVLATVGSWELTLSGAKSNPAQCKKERKILVNACKPVLYGKRPSSDCCRRLRGAHISCVCPVITPKLAALIDVNRAIRLVEGCGRRLPRHFKCGSVTIP